MNLRIFILKESGIVFLSKFFGTFLAVISAIFVARMLGPEFFGNYNLALATSTLILIFFGFGLRNTVVKYLPKYALHNTGKFNYLTKQSLRIILVLSVIAAVVFFTFTERIIELFHFGESINIFLKFIFVMLPVLALNDLLAGIFRGAKKASKFFVFKNMITPALYTALIVLIYIFRQDYRLILMARGLSYLVLLVLLLTYLKKKILTQGKSEKIFKREIKEIFGYSATLVFVATTGFLMLRIDKLMIGSLSTSYQLGLYSAGSNVGVLIAFFLGTATTVVAPLFSELKEKNDTERLKRLYKSSTIWVFYASLFSFVFFCTTSRDILHLFGEEYMTASTILIILSLGQLINASVGSNGALLRMTGYHKITLANNILVAIINIVLNYMLIRLYGALGAAIATAFSLALINTIKVVEVYIIYRIHPYNLKYVVILLFGIVEVFVFGFIGHFIGFTYYINLTIYFFMTLAFMGITLPFVLNKDDKILLDKITRKIALR